MAVAAREPGRVTRVAVYALCVDAGRVLLARWDGAGGAAWTLPGGPTAFGEEPTATVRREVLNATGVAIEPGGVLGIDSLRLPRPAPVHGGPVPPDVHAIRIVYSGRTVGRVFTRLPGGADACEWVGVEALCGLRRAELVDTALGWATLDTLV